MDAFNNGFKNCTSPHKQYHENDSKGEVGFPQKAIVYYQERCLGLSFKCTRTEGLNLAKPTVSNFWVFEFIIYTIFSHSTLFFAVLSINSPILPDLEEYLAAKRICIIGLQQINHFSKTLWSCMHLHKILETDKLIFKLNQRLGRS